MTDPRPAAPSPTLARLQAEHPNLCFVCGHTEGHFNFCEENKGRITIMNLLQDAITALDADAFKLKETIEKQAKLFQTACEEIASLMEQLEEADRGLIQSKARGELSPTAMEAYCHAKENAFNRNDDREATRKESRRAHP